ncbi:Hpt domain-containing protein [Marinicrinis sediminis]|uniref:Hpt domain-containing protein n=1 Tax=Marinicrinis sediminis TaxID=1652465 RepID=A0ABW5R6G8_9BACL
MIDSNIFNTPVVDAERIHRIKQMLNDEKVEIAELFLIFLTQSSEQIRALSSMLLTPEDQESNMAGIAHQLKGASLNFGALRLAACSAYIEQLCSALPSPDHALHLSEAHNALMHIWADTERSYETILNK